ncbi:prephenate dehydratase domain-containing protein [Nocardioides sp. R-C-SC26]|uniref:prephenate dehydratase n=1 Tax=Nocardioides sp. R-C-SC26 TaxID=2870414 RepID=UPI001E4D4C67|nr:prephenate dehydratase domain-containing protein [Nocardioides sp. R-C-SC26]
MSTRVAYLGPPGTFTHQAVVALRPGEESVALTTQAEALGAVAGGSVEYAVLPIDNSVNGVVVPTLDALLERPDLSIVDSVVVPISFDAFTRDPDVEPTVVVSHPHALAQCRAWIEARGLSTREASSTAAACRDVAPGEIAIGPAICGTLYDLHRLDSAVEDNAAAFTQFALVAATGPRGVSAARAASAGSGGEGLLVSLMPDHNEPGILRRYLGVLEDRAINMTNLVTRPVPDRPGIYMFLVFLAGTFTAADFEEMQQAWATQGGTARAIGRISPLAELAARG